MSGPIRIAIPPIGVPAQSQSMGLLADVNPEALSPSEDTVAASDNTVQRFIGLDKAELKNKIDPKRYIGSPMTIQSRMNLGILRGIDAAKLKPYPVPRGEYVPLWNFAVFFKAMIDVQQITQSYPGSDLTTNQRLLFLACVGEFFHEHLKIPPIKDIQLARLKRSPGLNLKMTRLKRMFQLYREQPTPENAVKVEDVLSDMDLLKKDAKSLPTDLTKGLAPILEMLADKEILLVIEALSLFYDAE